MASSEEEATTQSIADDECLSVRKWWCFLLSSIFTFLAGLLVVLVWRACAFVCCRREPDLAPNDPKQKEQKAARQNKQEFEGTFMTEAKDWAGELISGQTTTGRILVSTRRRTPSPSAVTSPIAIDLALDEIYHADTLIFT
ncbi:Calcium-activated potassium channel slowpoke [Eumeta japonica]|uniref:Calcium-activated potassium channel slowpoke n=1 Tax=Eumeta variegata TaxID=151549 RepID=A0A4C1TY31_EUMVA|nr:Calcium-activated potassium channel slowpoke [Eumeta japonica]